MVLFPWEANGRRGFSGRKSSLAAVSQWLRNPMNEAIEVVMGAPAVVHGPYPSISAAIRTSEGLIRSWEANGRWRFSGRWAV